MTDFVEVFYSVIYGIFHMPCMFHLLTGLYCPGCGGTRAVRYLLRGDLVQSFVYHPLVPYMALVVLFLAGSKALAVIKKRPEWCPVREMTFVYVGAGIILVNWIVKNICLIFWGIDLLAVPL